jgi:hypothetical protein
MDMASKGYVLLTLAVERFPNLTDAERTLLQAVTAGELADYRSPNAAKNDPQHAETWGVSRTIRAKVIRWLCADSEASRRIDPHGIHIHAATIAGQLDLAYVTLLVPLTLRRCALDAGVTLVGATTRTLRFSGSILGPSDGSALDAAGAQVHGGIFLSEGFRAEGTVRLVGASIGGTLDCTRGTFHCPGGDALDANRARVDDYVFLANGFRAEGTVRLVGASIGGDLNCARGTIHRPGGDALVADRARVEGTAFLEVFQVEGTVRLVGVRVGRLVDDNASWPAPGHLWLDGFAYTAITGPTDATARLAWLARQPPTPFRPQPYLQLAKVLRESGHEADAKRVLIAKERARRKQKRWWTRGWSYLLDATIRYGYQPWRALIWAGFWVVLGGILFGAGYQKEIVIPAKAEAYDADKKTLKAAAFYPAFNRWLYALDTFVPIINFGQKDYWAPQVACNKSGLIRGAGIRLCILGILNKPAIRVLYLYRCLHIVAGWVLITLVVTGFTNLVRRE